MKELKATPVETASQTLESQLKACKLAYGKLFGENASLEGRLEDAESQLTQVRSDRDHWKQRTESMSSKREAALNQSSYWEKACNAAELELTQVREELRQAAETSKVIWENWGKAEAENKKLRALLEEFPHDHTRSWDVEANKYVCETDCRGCEIRKALHFSTPEEVL